MPKLGNVTVWGWPSNVQHASLLILSGPGQRDRKDTLLVPQVRSVAAARSTSVCTSA